MKTVMRKWILALFVALAAASAAAQVGAAREVPVAAGTQEIVYSVAVIFELR